MLYDMIVMLTISRGVVYRAEISVFTRVGQPGTEAAVPRLS